MKKTLIGAIFLFSGMVTCLTIIILAANVLPSIDTYTGTKIWFAIFGASGYEIYSLNLGVPFIIGIIFVTLGFIILVKELLADYFTKR
ncbi:hypothetical protein [Paenibacillus tepidiphilus]|uniref:hypothetical protein n=1 Tax=Paenibacillus tepidiphilus TaxID=2608683 RepID=UPI00123860A2|nr:hypothetical protein [Paenibacillus tepidiphilus]